VKNRGESEDTLYCVGGGNDHYFFGSIQASPARPSDKGIRKVKTLEWLEVVA
jgi:hypothetical protein